MAGVVRPLRECGRLGWRFIGLLGFAEIGTGSGSVEPLEELFGPPVAAVSPR